jgi:hypothetical protein
LVILRRRFYTLAEAYFAADPSPVSADVLRVQQSFKAGGVRAYDFGGWYEGSTDEAKLGIEPRPVTLS